MSRPLTKPRSPGAPTLTAAARAAYACCSRIGRPELVTDLLAELDEERVSTRRRIGEATSSTFCPNEAYLLDTEREMLLARALFALLGVPTTVTVEEELMHT